MKVSNRLLIILLGLAIASFAVAAGLFFYEPEPEQTFVKDSLLIQGVAPEKIHQIVIQKGDETATLTKQEDGGFTIKERAGYPASTKEVNEILLKFLDLRCAEKITTNPKNHEELGVAEDKASEGVFSLLDGEGNGIAQVLIGEEAEASGRYVRLKGDDTVYSSTESIWYQARPMSFIDETIVDVAASDIQQIEVKTDTQTYSIVRVDGSLKLQDVPEGKRAKSSELTAVAGVLASLRFTDVKKAEDANITWTGTYTAKLKEDKHKSYMIRLGKKGEKDYIQIQGKGPDAEALRKNNRISQTEGEESLKKKDAIWSAFEDIEAFNQRHSGWVYEIDNWKAEKMRKPLNDLIEAIPEKDDPEKVAASHILISYKGADRASDKITRTKEEAKKRAAEVLEKAKAPDADFAALAKEYSDGPSSVKGGDLGTFGKGQMHPNFEKATWKLKVGELSGIVETPFGFHIIKRTE